MEAVAFYRRAYPRPVEATNQAILLGNLGNSLRSLGQVDEAIAAYTEAIALDPSQSTLHIALAETLLEARRTANAISCLTDVMMLPPFDEWQPQVQARCYGLLARAYGEEQQYPASLLFTWLSNGGRINEDDREGVSSLLKSLFRWGIGEPGQPACDYLLAKLNRNLGYFEAALHHAKRAVKAQPDRAEHFLELGASLMMQDKLPVALEAFEEAEALAPDRGEVHALRALALWELDAELAKEAIAEAIRLEPNQALHHCDLAYMHQAEGDEALAQEAFQTALLLNEDAPVIYGPHGPATHRGCYSDVIEPFLAENANSPEAATRLLTAANFLILSRRPETARKALHRLLSEQPTHLDALRNYAWLLMRQGFTQEALSIWRKVIMIAPEDDISRYFALSTLASTGLEGKHAVIRELDLTLAQRPDYHLGRLLLAKLVEPAPEALLHLEMLCAKLPNLHTPWYCRGQSHFHRGEHDEAAAALERSVKLHSCFPPARQLLAQVYQQLGHEAKAHVEL
ncbi:MAG: tetratricopeptide repeat protein, partial [Candidatus Sericytochromatia bacterium]